MSRKSKGAVLDPYGIGGAKARLKFQALMQDYHELEKVFNFSFLFWEI